MKFQAPVFYAILLMATGLHSQVPFMDSTYTWTEVLYYPLGHDSFLRTLSSTPTEYNGKIYYEILSSDQENGGAWDPTWIFLRYEDQKLYEGFSNGEILIFDYSLEAHDTFVSDGTPSFIILETDSIMLGNGELRKRHRTRCTDDSAWGDWPIYWIEGLGSTAGLNEYHSVCAYDAGSALMCIWKDDVRLYSNPDVDSCWLVPVSTTDIQALRIRILPNPASHKIILEDPDQQVGEVNVFDMFGRCVLSGLSPDKPIDIADLPSGQYAIILTLQNGQRNSTLWLKI